MKKLYKIIPIVIIGILVLVSCEKDKPELKYTGSNFIAYMDTSYVTEENTPNIVVIPVSLAAPQQSGSITVDLDVTSPDNSATEGVHYNLLAPTDGKITFESGVFFDSIKVEVIDNADEDGNKSIDFTLSNAPAGITLGLPGPDGRNQKTNLLITDNDCAFIPEDFTGKVSGTEFYPNNPYTTDAEFKLVSSDATSTVYEVRGIMQSVYAGWGEVVDDPGAGTGSNGNVAIVTFDFTDPLNPAISITEQNLSTTDGGAWIYDILEDPANTSKFSTCEKTIELYYQINVSEPGADYGARACYIKGDFLGE